MRFFVLLFPLIAFAILPQAEMDEISKKHFDANTSFVFTYADKQLKYFVVIYAEEKFSSTDILDEEIPYLKAGIQATLFDYMKKKYPKLISIQVSKLLYGPFWDSNNFFHGLAQVNILDVKPIYQTKNLPSEDTINHVDKNISSQSDNHRQFSISYDTNHKTVLEKINYLEKKSKEQPSNIKILNKLKILYKNSGDTEEYSKINDRIMDIRMGI